MRPILDVASDLGLARSDVHLHGDHVAKVALAAIPPRRRAKLVLVTATTPTAQGEGKTVTAIGLADGLAALGQRAVVAIRQGSLGPLFGRKGGATGGGRARVVPSQMIDLHFTGDGHAVTLAQDLVVALAEASAHHGNPRKLARVTLPRCLDVNDRTLRAAGFVITAASETMAILSLTTSYHDLRARLGRMVVGVDDAGAFVTADDVGASGAAAALLRDALMPNLVQTSEGVPALVHAGPFGNVSHGHSSIVADRLALGRSDILVTEAGFGADLGAEKFVDLVAPQGLPSPDLAVLVTSARALREQGLDNLRAHLRILRELGAPALVAINRFPSDTQTDVRAIGDVASAAGVAWGEHTAFHDGGRGCVELAARVLDGLHQPRPNAAPIYDASTSLLGKLRAVATRIYGADGVSLSPDAEAALAKLGGTTVHAAPVCIAKTPMSLSDDPARRGAPTGWTLRVKALAPAAGAGYIVALAGDVLLMPGLGPEPAARRIDLDGEGHILGL